MDKNSLDQKPLEVFNFFGDFKKSDEEDEAPIKEFSASIYCCENGDIFLGIKSQVFEQINWKKFLESSPTYNIKPKVDVSRETLLNPLFLSESSNFEKELVQSPYEGHYVVEGKTLENWSVKARIADLGFIASFRDAESEDLSDQDIEKFIRLSELNIDSDPNISSGNIVEAVYGLKNAEVLYDFSTKILASKVGLEIKSVAVGNRKKEDLVSAEIKLKNLSKSEEFTHGMYYAWIESLLSFSLGNSVTQIYRIERVESEIGAKFHEYWIGRKTPRKSLSVAVIQEPLLPDFIRSCAPEITIENFIENGLGLALAWYAQAFAYPTVGSQFIILFTVLETLAKKYKSKSDKQGGVIPTQLYRRVRDKIFAVLVQQEEEISDSETLNNYKVFRSKVEKPFKDASYNQFSNVRSNLKDMLEHYSVPYRDLFPKLEFIQVRNDLVHGGSSETDVGLELRKLANLVVRLILSMLKYEGDYIESKPIYTQRKAGHMKYGLAYKKFPFTET